MNKLENGIGKKFGRLTPIEIIREKGKNAKYRCVCDCGNEIITWYNNLYIGKTLSCGCLANESRHRTDNKAHKIKHGLSKTRLSKIRNGMISRCYNEKSCNYNAYGGRGIKMCDEWKNKETGMQNFYNWAMANGYRDGLTIERKDVNGNYCPENCTWITMEEQYKNKREYNYDEMKKQAFFNRELISLLDKRGVRFVTIRQRMKKYQITFEEAMKMDKYSSYNLPKINKYLDIYIDKEKRVLERNKIISKLKDNII